MAATIFDRMDLRKTRLARLSHALHKRAGGVSAAEYEALCQEVYKIVDPVADPQGCLREIGRRLRALDPARVRPAEASRDE